MKTDLRVVKTHQAIRGALVSLLKTKPFADIAAQEIYAAALVNRTTFYKYYSGKRDLAAKMIADFKQQYAASLAMRLEADHLSAALQQAAQEIFAQHELLLALWQVETPRLHLFADMKAMLQQHFAALTGNDFRALLMATLLLETVRFYFARGEMVPVAQVVEEMEAVVRLFRG